MGAEKIMFPVQTYIDRYVYGLGKYRVASKNKNIIYFKNGCSFAEGIFTKIFRHLNQIGAEKIRFPIQTYIERYAAYRNYRVASKTKNITYIML